MEELLEQIQKGQNRLIEQYFVETSAQKKEEIRKKLFILSKKYAEISKNINI